MGGLVTWYSDEGTGWGRSPPRPLIAVPNVTAQNYLVTRINWITNIDIIVSIIIAFLILKFYPCSKDHHRSNYYNFFWTLGRYINTVCIQSEIYY